MWTDQGNSFMDYVSFGAGFSGAVRKGYDWTNDGVSGLRNYREAITPRVIHYQPIHTLTSGTLLSGIDASTWSMRRLTIARWWVLRSKGVTLPELAVWQIIDPNLDRWNEFR